MSYYVYSTATCGTDYTIYAENNSKDVAVVRRKITIKGGHLVATKNLVTPKGVVTEVSDEDMELLQKDFHFQEHVKLGFLSVQKREIAPEKVAKDMAEKDKSSPITPEDYEKNDEEAGNSTVIYRKRGKRI